MNKLLLVIVLCANLAFEVKSQIVNEAKIVFSPLIVHLDYDFSETTIHNSYGVDLRSYIFKKMVYLEGGIYYRVLGAQFELPPSITIPFDHKLIYKVKSIDLPISLGLRLFDSKRIRFGSSIGLNYGRLIEQKGIKRGIEKDIGVYNNHMLSLIYGVEIGVNISSKTSILIIPNWLSQIDENKTTFAQKGKGIAFSFLYRFGNNSDKK